MNYQDEVIKAMQNNNILAKKLDQAVLGVSDAVSDQINNIQAGTTRLVYYTSCFTDEYYDVCSKQGVEDLRFAIGIGKLAKGQNIIQEMLQIYFNTLFRRRTRQQLEYIKKIIMKANIHITSSTLTSQGFALAITASIYSRIITSLKLSRFIGKTSGSIFSALGIYGITQKAADSARRLQYSHPLYYNALYQRELEMMFILLESVFVKAGALKTQWLSDDDVARIITNMANQS